MVLSRPALNTPLPWRGGTAWLQFIPAHIEAFLPRVEWELNHGHHQDGKLAQRARPSGLSLVKQSANAGEIPRFQQELFLPAFPVPIGS
jgi:hypothetical protein